MDILDKFGKKIRALREKKKMSQEDLAFKADLSVYYISRIERGKANPSLETIHRLASTFKITISELF